MSLQPEYHQLVLDLALDELAAGGELRLRVVSDSMAPLLRTGEAVLLAPTRPSELHRGDLVLLRREAEWVTHRLVCREAGGWRTKGDNSRSLDARVAHQDILGKVAAIERAGRRRDLDSRRWSLTNRVLGWLSWGEAQLYRTGREEQAAGGAGNALLRSLGRVASRLLYGLRRLVDFLA